MANTIVTGSLTITGQSTSFTIREAVNFEVEGNISKTTPIFSWIVENTTSYVIDCKPSYVGNSRHANFSFNVRFSDDSEAVAFKLRWWDRTTDFD